MSHDLRHLVIDVDTARRDSIRLWLAIGLSVLILALGVAADLGGWLI